MWFPRRHVKRTNFFSTSFDRTWKVLIQTRPTFIYLFSFVKSNVSRKKFLFNSKINLLHKITLWEKNQDHVCWLADRYVNWYINGIKSQGYNSLQKNDVTLLFQVVETHHAFPRAVTLFAILVRSHYPELHGEIAALFLVCCVTLVSLSQHLRRDGVQRRCVNLRR